MAQVNSSSYIDTADFFADDGRRVFNALLDSDEEEGDSGMRGDDAANKSVRFAPLPLVNDQAVLPTTPIGSARPKPADKTEEEPSGILRATALYSPRWRSPERARPRATVTKAAGPRTSSLERPRTATRKGAIVKNITPRNRSASPMWRASRPRPQSARSQEPPAAQAQQPKPLKHTLSKGPELRTAVRAIRRSASAEPQRPTSATVTRLPVGRSSGQRSRPGSADMRSGVRSYERHTSTSRCRSTSPQKRKPDRALPWELRDPVPGPGAHNTSQTLIGLASMGDQAPADDAAKPGFVSPISSKHQFFPRPRPRVAAGLASPPAATAKVLTSPRTPRTISYFDGADGTAAEGGTSPRSRVRGGALQRTQSSASSMSSSFRSDVRTLRSINSSHSIQLSTTQFKVDPGFSFSRSSRFQPAMFLGGTSDPANGSNGGSASARKSRSQWKEVMSAGDPSSPGPAKYAGREPITSTSSRPGRSRTTFTTTHRKPLPGFNTETGPTVGPGSYSPAPLTRTRSRVSNSEAEQ